ncbi:unnamed protein product [Fusarium fujikuroi]|nr:hypothetical protein CEK25_010591 [Fusarium fujikuroi]VTT76337.1 unnamed protein product [Fusarium fujikuroi]
MAGNFAFEKIGAFKTSQVFSCYVQEFGAFYRVCIFGGTNQKELAQTVGLREVSKPKGRL